MPKTPGHPLLFCKNSRSRSPFKKPESPTSATIPRSNPSDLTRTHEPTQPARRPPRSLLNDRPEPGTLAFLAFEHEKRSALRLLEGIEQGTMTVDESYQELIEVDPVLVHFIFKWLRKRYRDHPAAEGVLGRLAVLCNDHRDITRHAKGGEDDPVVGWFEGSYSYKDLDAREFIDLVVEKLEG